MSLRFFPITRRACVALLGLAPALAWAQGGKPADYPSAPVRVIVPAPPGGTMDTMTRRVTQHLSEKGGTSFIIENRPGGAGTIGTSAAARAAPDGYNLVTVDTTFAIYPSVYASLSFDHANAFVPVAGIAQFPVAAVVGANSPFKTLEELVAHARANPGKLTFGSGGHGSSTHLQAEVFRQKAGVDLTHIPYKGGGDAVVAVMGGQIDVLFTGLPTVAAAIQGGKLRALALTGDQRLEMLGGVPTFAESGFPAYQEHYWAGLAAPQGTPMPIVEALNAQIRQAVADPALAEWFRSLGAQPSAQTPAEFADYLRNEVQAWSAAAKAANVQPQ